ncbi:hypothetical protein [uncultured Formosa sp.]|uniref:hypothetical protein n=1 Tax=uncultured Formosa sp. TaxID=255435 RepID=UPI002612F097|nr:hypothetical protein [uncultured Formosa sp.]
MTDNIFVDRFKKMTNEELEAISFNEKVYTNEARLTALDILKSRGLNTDAINKTHSVLTAKSIAEKNIIINDTPNVSAGTRSKLKALPELYSKSLILAISILFSPLFGSVLLIYNFKDSKLKKARNHVILFIIGYIFIVVLISLFSLNSNFALIINVIGAFILTEYFWNTYLGKSIEYKKRNWAKPVLIILAITIPLTYFVLKSGGAL